MVWNFYGCLGVESVTIGANVQLIGDCVFMYCRNLQSVTIGSGVISIGAWAFSVCESLTNAIKNTEGWHVSIYEDINVYNPVNVNNPQVNADYLKNRYCNCYWERI